MEKVIINMSFGHNIRKQNYYYPLPLTTLFSVKTLDRFI